MDKLKILSPKIAEYFPAHIDVVTLSNDELVAVGREYAREKEYSIDEMGI